MLSERLKKCRKRKKVTQKQVAEFLDMTVNAYQKYELKEREPNLETLAVLANFFDVPTDYLLGQGFFANWDLVYKHRDKVIGFLYDMTEGQDLFPETFWAILSKASETDLMRIFVVLFDKIDIDEERERIEITLRGEVLSETPPEKRE